MGLEDFVGSVQKEIKLNEKTEMERITDHIEEEMKAKNKKKETVPGKLNESLEVPVNENVDSTIISIIKELSESEKITYDDIFDAVSNSDAIDFICDEIIEKLKTAGKKIEDFEDEEVEENKE